MASSNGASTSQQLGAYICHANPYTRKQDPSAALPTPMDLRLAEAEVDDQSDVWPHSALTFKHETYPLAHVTRIPYDYIDEHEIPRRKYLFIGFAASTGE
jgi:hypothetical protein